MGIAGPAAARRALQQLALGIVGALGDGSTVQVEQDAVESCAHGLAQVGEHLVADARKGVGGDAVGGHGAGPHRRHERPASGAGLAHEAGDGQAASTHLLEHR